LCSWSYDGSSRRLSAWSANGAELFHQEIERAADSIIDDVIGNLEQGKGECIGRMRNPAFSDSSDVSSLRTQADEAAMYDYGVKTAAPDKARKASTNGPDSAERRRLICQSAHDGYPPAQRRMGRYFLEPDDPEPQDLVQAFKWYQLANISEGRVRSAAAVALRMTYEQRLESDRLVAEWKPNPDECEAFGAKAEN
jgi:TPR repeat protein